MLQRIEGQGNLIQLLYICAWHRVLPPPPLLVPKWLTRGQDSFRIAYTNIRGKLLETQDRMFRDVILRLLSTTGAV